MYKVVKIKLNMSQHEENILRAQSNLCTKLWNLLVDVVDFEKDYYRTNCKNLNFNPYNKYQLRNQVPKLKKQYPVLNTIYSSCAKNVAIKMHTSLSQWHVVKYHFIKENNRVSLCYDQNTQGYVVNNKELKLSQGMHTDSNGDKHHSSIVIKMNKKFKYLQKDIKILEIVYNKNEKRYFANFTVEITDLKKKIINSSIALDLNHKNAFVAYDSNHKCLEVFNYYVIKSTEKQIKSIQRKKSKCKKNSRRFKFLQSKLNKLFSKRSRQTKDFCRNIANYLCKNYDLIGVGNYTPSIQKNKNMNRYMKNLGAFGQLRKAIEQCCERSGKYYQLLDEKNTTKTCSKCLTIGPRIEPSVREWTCSSCQTHHVRDENAAQNLWRLLSAIREEKNLELAPNLMMPCSGDLNILSRSTYRFNGSQRVIKDRASIVSDNRKLDKKSISFADAIQ